MMHTHRPFGLGDVPTVEELAEKLGTKGRTWTLCTGFRFGSTVDLGRFVPRVHPHGFCGLCQ